MPDTVEGLGASVSEVGFRVLANRVQGFGQLWGYSKLKGFEFSAVFRVEFGGN